MATSLATIRQAIGDKLDCYVKGTVTSAGAVDRFVCSDLVTTKTSEFNKGWLVFADSAVQHVVTSYSNVTGLVVFKPPRTNAATGVFELWKTFSPSNVNEAINNVLTEQGIYTTRDETTALAADTYTYDVPTDAVRLTDLEWQDTNGNWQKLSPYRYYGQRGAFTVELMGYAKQIADNYAGQPIRFIYDRHYASLASDGETTTCQLPWVKMKAVTYLMAGRAMARPSDPNREAFLQNASLANSEAEMNNDIEMNAPRMTPTRRVTE